MTDSPYGCLVQYILVLIYAPILTITSLLRVEQLPIVRSKSKPVSPYLDTDHILCFTVDTYVVVPTLWRNRSKISVESIQLLVISPTSTCIFLKEAAGYLYCIWLALQQVSLFINHSSIHQKIGQSQKVKV